MKLKAFLLSVLVVVSSCTDPNQANPETPTPSEPAVSYIVNGDMEEEISTEIVKLADLAPGKWGYVGGWNANAATVAHEEGRGVKNSKCLSILAMIRIRTLCSHRRSQVSSRADIIRLLQRSRLT